MLEKMESEGKNQRKLTTTKTAKENSKENYRWRTGEGKKS